MPLGPFELPAVAQAGVGHVTDGLTGIMQLMP
jgi:hypothetical protein